MRLLRKVAAALNKLHNHNAKKDNQPVLHHDLRTCCIALTRSNQPKVMGCGVIPFDEHRNIPPVAHSIVEEMHAFGVLVAEVLIGQPVSAGTIPFSSFSCLKSVYVVKRGGGYV